MSSCSASLLRNSYWVQYINKASSFWDKWTCWKALSPFVLLTFPLTLKHLDLAAFSPPDEHGLFEHSIQPRCTSSYCRIHRCYGKALYLPNLLISCICTSVSTQCDTDIDRIRVMRIHIGSCYFSFQLLVTKESSFSMSTLQAEPRVNDHHLHRRWFKSDKKNRPKAVYLVDYSEFTNLPRG